MGKELSTKRGWFFNGDWGENVANWGLGTDDNENKRMEQQVANEQFANNCLNEGSCLPKERCKTRAFSLIVLVSVWSWP